MITVAQLLRRIDHSVDAVIGDLNARIGQPKALNSGAGQAFSFCRIEGDEGREAVRGSSASVVVVPLAADKTWCRADQTLIRSPSPRKTFLRALHEIVPAETADPGVHPTAVVDDLAEVDPTASIGALCVIHRSVKIGPRTVLHPGVVVNPDTHIGADCVLHPGVVIGADGFGYERDEDGSIIKFPHLGGVRIGENVEIGANSCIDRGTLGNTILEDGVKVDNLVHIAHNVRVGSRSFVIAQSMIGGSVDIGADVWVAPASAVLNGLSVGSRSLIGLGAVVIRDVPPDSVVMGNPARLKPEQ